MYWGKSNPLPYISKARIPNPLSKHVYLSSTLEKRCLNKFNKHPFIYNVKLITKEKLVIGFHLFQNLIGSLCNRVRF